MKTEDLFGKLSETGKPFNCGYHISTIKGIIYFAEGEEKERDEYLKKHSIFDEETPNWDELYEEYGEDFYYSEWFVADDMDGGYDENGDYYEYKPLSKTWVKEFDLGDYEIIGGDGVEHELWEHKSTKKLVTIPIEIVRDFDNLTFH